LSHGLISAALFLCVGVVYDRLHTREISRYGGIVKNMPRYATVFMIFMLASVGLPGTSGFVGEFLSLLGAFQVDTIVAAAAATGLILGAAYMLMLYRRMMFGEAKNKDAAAMHDMNPRELWILLPLVALVLYLGVVPNAVLDKISPSVEKLISQHESGLIKTKALENQVVVKQPLIMQTAGE
jgi:NADH-quinone oxidoreductase subunit M